MRSRSGAIHCESEDDFITLAEATHNTTAVFYDERSHRTLSQRLAHKPLLPSTLHDLSLSTALTPPRTYPATFSDFDFAVEDEAAREERAQIEKGRLAGVQAHVLIRASDYLEVVGWLWRTLGAGGRAVEHGRKLQLVVESNGYGVYKYWVLGGGHQADNQVMEIYQRHPPYQLRLNVHQQTYSLLRGDLASIGGSSVVRCLLSQWKVES